MTSFTSSRESGGNQLHNLRSFCIAAQFGSISKAAELGAAQPTHGLAANPVAGEGIPDRALPAPRAENPAHRGRSDALRSGASAGRWDRLAPLGPAASREGLVAGRLDIAAGEATILYILPEIIREFAASHPGMELRLQNVSGREGLKLLRNDAVDFAVGSLIDVPVDITYQPAFTFEPMLITPLDHPLSRLRKVTLKDVSHYPLILPPQNLTTWRMADFVFRKYHLTHRVVLVAGGWEVIKRYVELGVGISIVTGVCLTGKESLAAIPFSKYFPKRTYGIVLRKSKLLSPAAARFVEMIRAHAKSHQPNGPEPGRRD